MNEVVRHCLVDLAHKGRGSIGYQELSDKCHLNLVMHESKYASAEIGRIFGEISRFEHKAGRPLISSLVITKGDHYQGDGFFRLAEELGFGSWKELRDGLEFEFKQMSACYTFWGDPEHYAQYR
jgi:hypothetical protein